MGPRGARWRVRSFAALWISAAPGLGPALGVRSSIPKPPILTFAPYDILYILLMLPESFLEKLLRPRHLRRVTTTKTVLGASKTPPRRLQFFIIFSMALWIDFEFIFPPNLAPKIYQNRSKTDAEMDSHVDLIFGSIFDRFIDLPLFFLHFKQNLTFEDKIGF